jgi:IS30 family transposase
MDCTNYTTETRKGQHLSLEERVVIQTRLKDGWNTNMIAKELGRSYNCIKTEIKRGMTSLYNGKVMRYKARTGQMVYELNRRNCVKSISIMNCMSFIRYVEQKFEEEHWSLDACVGAALESGEFRRDEIVCTKTLYNYVDAGLMKIKNIDLPEKVSRKQKRKRIRENKRKLGDSIEERPKSVDSREEFGHWEFDSVIGKNGEDEPAVVTMVERKTRKCIWLRVCNHTADALMEAVKTTFEPYKSCIDQIFKTITADNGSEFVKLNELKNEVGGVYFTHPYSSFEKGTNECHNKMLRRFIPKGRSIAGYSQEDIDYFADIINGLPRKILGYKTPDELFDRELDLIYADFGTA